jgi:hypothetical protein
MGADRKRRDSIDEPYRSLAILVLPQDEGGLVVD